MFTMLIRKLLLLLVIPMLMIGWVPVAGATQPDGPVTIVTKIDFSIFPFTATFEVTEGDTILPCMSGVTKGFPRGSGVIRKVFTCIEGGEGTFTFLFAPFASPHWVVWKATGAFDGMRGEGVFSLVMIDEITGQETFTGMIHFKP